MANTMQFDLVSPERRLASLQADEVHLPGSEGDMTALPDHAPVITTLRPGIVTVVADGTESRYLVLGGFAEVTPEGTSVLAERAMPVEEVSQAAIDALIADAHSAHKAVHGEAVTDEFAKLMADMVAAGEHIGLSPKQPSL